MEEEMYIQSPLKLLIADDEYFIRQRIKKIIPYEKLGLILTAQAQDGEELLREMSRTPADIILLDIHMPHMNGLEAAAVLSREFPDTKMIILSGYGEFEYAKQAIKYNVFDYLLKPIEEQTLEETLARCVRTVRTERRQKESYVDMETRTVRHRLEQIRDGHIRFSDLLDQFPSCRPFHSVVFAGVYTRTDPARQQTNPVREISSCLDTCCSRYGQEDSGKPLSFFHCTQEDTNTYLLWLVLSPRQAEMFLSEGADRLRKYMTDLFLASDSRMFAVIGDPIPLDTGMKTESEEIIKYLLKRYSFKGNYFFTKKELKTIETSVHGAMPKDALPSLYGLRQNVTALLNTDSPERLYDLLYEKIQSVCLAHKEQMLDTLVSEYLLTLHLYLEHTSSEEAFPPALSVDLIEDEWECEQLARSLCSLAESYTGVRKTVPSDISYANKIIELIDTNYADPNLNVAMIASRLGLNASYVGTLFKNVQNQSILQQIASTRMAHAKELLQDGTYKVSQIASLVGFTDVYYFSKCFKKTFGVSPKDYMDKLGSI